MALNYAKTNTFVLGTTISSSSVNANFDDVVNAFGGLENLSKSLSNLYVDTTFRSSGTVQFADGTAGAPALVFTSDTLTGLYKIATSNLGFATAGTLRFNISSTAMTAALPLAMGSNKITGLAAATANGDALRYEQSGVWATPVVASEVTGGSTTSASFSNIGATVTTAVPASSASKYLIFAQAVVGGSAANTLCVLGVNGTTTGDLLTTVTSPARAQGTNAASISLLLVDSPASALAQTYQMRGAGNAVGTSSFGNAAATGAQTRIMAWEIR